MAASAIQATGLKLILPDSIWKDKNTCNIVGFRAPFRMQSPVICTGFLPPCRHYSRTEKDIRIHTQGRRGGYTVHPVPAPLSTVLQVEGLVIVEAIKILCCLYVGMLCLLLLVLKVLIGFQTHQLELIQRKL